MPAPYDYTIKTANPLMAGLQGYEMAQQQRARAMALEQQQAQMAEEERKRQRQQQYQQDIIKLTENPFSSADDYVKLQAMYPESMEAIKQVQQGRSKAQLQGDVEQVQKIGAAFAAGKNDIAINQIVNYRNALENSGRENEVQSIDNILEMAKENPGAVSAELNKYLLAQMGPEAFTNYFKQIQMGAGQARAIRSETYPDGTSLKVMSIGPPEIWSASGEKLTGQEAADAIFRAQEYGSELAKRINFNRKEGELEAQKGLKAEIEGEVKAAGAAIKRSEEFGKKADLAGERILKIDNAISIAEQAIAEGKSLGRGWFEGKFPKMNKYPVLMQQAAYDLGLGVVQATTFGALSKGELDTAMKTALPEFADDRDTVEWLKKRKAAEEKIQRELNRAAIYLGKPGNTVAMWRKLQQDIRSGKITPEEAYGEVEPKQQTTELINQPQQTEGQSRKTQLFNRLMQIQQSKGQ